MPNSQPRYTLVNTTLTTDITVASADANHKFSVYHVFYRVPTNGAGTITWKSGSTTISTAVHVANDIRDSQVDPGESGQVGMFKTSSHNETLFVSFTGAAASTPFQMEVGYTRIDPKIPQP